MLTGAAPDLGFQYGPKLMRAHITLILLYCIPHLGECASCMNVLAYKYLGLVAFICPVFLWFALFCHLPSPSPNIAMETRYFGALVGMLHIVCLWALTRPMATALNDTRVPRYIVWIPFAMGPIFFLTAIILLGFVVHGAIAPIWLLLFLLELAHCSEVDAGP